MHAVTIRELGRRRSAVAGEGGTPRRPEPAVAGSLGSGPKASRAQSVDSTVKGGPGCPHSVPRLGLGREATGVTRTGGKSGRLGQPGYARHTWSGDARVSIQFGEGAPCEPSRAQGAVPKAIEAVSATGTLWGQCPPSEIPN